MKTIIKIKTWKCSCGYAQDFEPTQELMDKHFNIAHPELFKNIQANQCPSCKVGRLILATLDEQLTTVTIDDEDDLPVNLSKEEKNAKVKEIRDKIKKYRMMEQK